MRNNYIVILLVLFCFSQSFGQNLVRGRSYKISPEPNYPKTASKSIESKVLTDGTLQKSIQPTFWTSGKSLGWTNKSEIIIDLDLGSNEKIGSVLINTANGENVGVYYPRNVFVFSSIDQKNYSYLGDLIDYNKTKTSNSTKSVNSLTLNNLNVSGRYLKFVVYPEKNYFFIDEIQVLKGSFSKSKSYSKTTAQKINSFLDGVKNNSKISLSTRNVSERKISSNSENPIQIQEVILNSDLNSSSVNSSNSNVTTINKASFLNNFNTVFLKISNNSNSQTIFTLKKSNNSASSILLYEVVSVKNSKVIDLFDALVPSNFSNTFTVEPNSDKFLVIKSRFNSSGNFKQNYLYSDNQKREFSITVNNKVIENRVESLNGINWSYFNYPQISNVRNLAITDLTNHGINAYSIPRDILSKFKSDKKSFRSYFNNIPTNSKILLFLNFAANNAKQIGGNKNNFLDPNWKKNFSIFILGVVNELNSLGYKNVLVYPYDEVKENEFKNFTLLMKWLRDDLKLKTYATVLSPSMVKVADYVDVVQLNRRVLNTASNRKSSSEKWIYDIFDYARDVNPIQYRKLAWEAYFYNAKGIGFWNYSQSNSNQNLISSSYSNGKGDYSVIYNSAKGGIIPSIRWESFYLGVQDYYKLKTLEKTKGKSWVNDLVSKVIKSNSKEQLEQYFNVLDENL